jgi:hypothetical protein
VVEIGIQVCYLIRLIGKMTYGIENCVFQIAYDIENLARPTIISHVGKGLP